MAETRGGAVFRGFFTPLNLLGLGGLVREAVLDGALESIGGQGGGNFQIDF